MQHLEIEFECMCECLTALWLQYIINYHCSSRMNHFNWRSTAIQDNVGEEEFISIIFTDIVWVDDDGVCLIGVSCVELYDLTNHTSIVIR